MASNSVSRRGFLGAAALAGAVVGARASADPVVTPSQTEGPFYPNVDQADKDADLTRIEGRDGAASGEVVEVTGQVMDANGAPLANAVVDVWQANAAGRYAHEADSNPAPLDPDFQGWAILTTDAQGRYRLRTIKPGAYPVMSGWSRPPHIHFKVALRGYREVTTQMYFDGEPLNDVDRVLNNHPEDERAALIAARDPDTGAYRFDVVLQAV
ncbi:MAG: protocatechuate 3,4-dioxygenase subunit alpha [Oceanicaulis sp.]